MPPGLLRSEVAGVDPLPCQRPSQAVERPVDAVVHVLRVAPANHASDLCGRFDEDQIAALANGPPETLCAVAAERKAECDEASRILGLAVRINV